MLAESDYPALLLNADFQPLFYYPLSTLRWKEAVERVLRGRLVLVEEWNKEIRSPSLTMRLPSVVALPEFDPMQRPAPLNRISIYLRDATPDGFRCLYCGRTMPQRELTFDHVIPRALGGTSFFENVVSACASCNGKKGCKTPREAGMKLLQQPWHPTIAELRQRGRWFAASTLRDEWYWTVELMP